MINKKAEKIMLRILAMMLCVTFLCGFAAPVAANASNEDVTVSTQAQGEPDNNDNDEKDTEEEPELSDQVPDDSLTGEESGISSAENNSGEEITLSDPVVKSIGPVKASPLGALPTVTFNFHNVVRDGSTYNKYYFHFQYVDKNGNNVDFYDYYGYEERNGIEVALNTPVTITQILGQYMDTSGVVHTGSTEYECALQIGGDKKQNNVNVFHVDQITEAYRSCNICFYESAEAAFGKLYVTKNAVNASDPNQSYHFVVLHHKDSYKMVATEFDLKNGETREIQYYYDWEYANNPDIFIAETTRSSNCDVEFKVNGVKYTLAKQDLYGRIHEDIGYGYDNLEFIKVPITKDQETLSVACTNTFKTSAKVTVSKTVTGSLSDLTKEFDFAVSYTDKDGKSQKDTFKLKNGGSRTITVQTGSKVTVTESGADEYKTSYTVDSGSSKNGKTCTLDKVSGNTAVNFKNTYEPTSTSVILGGTKTLTGFPETGTAKPVFTFTLSENGKVIDTKTVTKQGDYAFNKITYTQPGEHTYTVAETKGSQAGVTYDTKTYTVKVTVTDNKAGALVATITDGTGVTIDGKALDFANSYKPESVSVAFSGLKTLEGKDLAEGEFSFTLRGYGTTETVKNGADGKIAFTPITFYKVGTYTYTVREDATTESGITIDSTVYNITVTVTDDGSGQLKAVITDSTGTITGKDLNFKNTYKAGSTSVTLGGTKTFTGFPADSSIEPVFTFTLSEDGKVIDTKTVTKQGDYAFNKITYTEPGEHTYTVAETKGSQAGVTYDTKTYTVKVTVTDNKAGALVAAITDSTGATITGKTLNFENSYSAKPVSVQFSGLKTLEGRDLANAEFSFTLTGSGDKNETVKNAADGKIAFEPITYTEAGTYTYIVREEATTESGVTIDSTVYNITVTVTDDGSGQLKAVITDSTGTITGKDLNFKNTYKAGSTSVTLGGTKTLTGFPENGTAKPVFIFTLSENGTVIDTKTVTKQGGYAFDSIIYTEPGKHVYTIAETKGSEGGVTYDTKTYTVKVTVTDNKAGALVAAITGDSTSGTDLDFTNSYSAKPVSVQFSGLKTLEGRELANEEFSFTLTGSGDKNETVKNAADGKIAFEPITYTKAGTYTYEVKEEATREPGVTIDTKTYKITVTVTDDGSGQLAAAISGDTTIGTDLNFRNTFSYGSLAISKKVTGDLGDKNKEFTFKVEFDSDGYFSYTGSKSGMLESGDTVKLKHGESIVISGIPAGTKYRVTELGANGYYTYSTGDNGLIFANSTSTAAFTNTRSSVPKTGDSTDLKKWLGLTAACMGGLLFMAAPNKKKHGKHEV